MKITILLDMNYKHNLEIATKYLGDIIHAFENKGSKIGTFTFEDGEKYLSGIEEIKGDYQITIMKSNTTGFEKEQDKRRYFNY